MDVHREDVHGHRDVPGHQDQHQHLHGDHVYPAYLHHEHALPGDAHELLREHVLRHDYQVLVRELLNDIELQVDVVKQDYYDKQDDHEHPETLHDVNYDEHT